MKKRLTIAGIVLLLGALFLPIPALALHALLSREPELLSVSPIVCWKAVWEISQVRQFYLLLLLGELLGLIWIFAAASNLKYRSNMRYITPDIRTPEAAGQGQYGTARWLPRNQYGAAFTQYSLGSLISEELVEAGRKEAKRIETFKEEN